MKKEFFFVIGVFCLGLIVMAAMGTFSTPDQNTNYDSNYKSSDSGSNSVDTSKSNSPNTNNEEYDSLQVRIITSGSWSGSVGTADNSKTVNGYGDKIIKLDGSGLDITSATIQKENGDNSKLTVQIIKDGKIKKESSTTSPYGVVSIVD